MDPNFSNFQYPNDQNPNFPNPQYPNFQLPPNPNFPNYQFPPNPQNANFPIIPQYPNFQFPPNPNFSNFLPNPNHPKQPNPVPRKPNTNSNFPNSSKQKQPNPPQKSNNPNVKNPTSQRPQNQQNMPFFQQLPSYPQNPNPQFFTPPPQPQMPRQNPNKFPKMTESSSKRDSPSEEAIIEEAKRLYKAETGKDFEFMHVWRMLKDNPEWMRRFTGQTLPGHHHHASTSKKAKVCESKAPPQQPSSSSEEEDEDEEQEEGDEEEEQEEEEDEEKEEEDEEEDEEDEEDEEQEPPPQQQKQQDGGKEREEKTTKEDEVVKAMPEMQRVEVMKYSEALKKHAEAIELKAKVKQRELDMKCLYKDTSNLTPLQKQLHQQMLEQIKKRWEQDGC